MTYPCEIEYSLLIFENDSMMNLKLKKSISINHKFNFLFDSKNSLVLLTSQKLSGKNKFLVIYIFIKKFFL